MVFYSQVIIGNQGKANTKVVTEVDNYSSVAEDSLVAVHLEDKDGRPFIAKVVTMNDDSVLVHWMKGSWTGPWQMWSHGVGKKAKPYTSCIPTSSLILWNFSFTNSNKLKNATRLNLKMKYVELDG